MNRLGKLAVLFGIIFFLLLGCTPTVKEEAVLSINDKPVTEAVFRVYLYETAKSFYTIGGEDILDTDFDGKTGKEVMRERAVETVQNVVLTSQKAKELGVSLTEEEKNLAKEQAQSQIDAMPEDIRKQVGVSLEQMTGIMEDTLLYHKVFEVVTGEYQPSDADFQQYLKENRDILTRDYVPYSLSSILVADEATARVVVERARNGEDFSVLAQEFEIDEAEKDGGAMETYKGQIESYFGVVFDLEQGEVSEPLETAEGYYILRVDYKGEVTQELLESIAQVSYTMQKKQELFDEEFARWMSESNIVKNESLLSAVEIAPIEQ